MDAGKLAQTVVHTDLPDSYMGKFVPDFGFKPDINSQESQEATSVSHQMLLGQGSVHRANHLDFNAVCLEGLMTNFAIVLGQVGTC